MQTVFSNKSFGGPGRLQACSSETKTDMIFSVYVRLTPMRKLRWSGFVRD